MPTPRRRRRPAEAAVAAAFVAVGLLAWPQPAHAQLFVAVGRDTLKRLPGVEVLVEPMQSELDAGPLATGSIAAAVVAQLRAGGVVVFPSQQGNPSPSKPYLYVHVNAASAESGGPYAVAIQVHLRQTMASLTTESKVVDAMTWDAHDVAIVSPEVLSATVLGDIHALVGRFIDDWRAVH